MEFEKHNLLQFLKKHDIEPEYEFHPYSYYYPLMSEEELYKLGNDIKEKELLDKIIIFENMILDGKNRYIACKLCGYKLDTKIHFAQLPSDKNPLDFVWSKNDLRRHLTLVKRIAIYNKILPEQQRLAKERQRQTQFNGRTPDGKPRRKGSVRSQGSTTELSQVKKNLSKKNCTKEARIGVRTMSMITKMQQQAEKHPEIGKILIQVVGEKISVTEGYRKALKIASATPNPSTKTDNPELDDKKELTKHIDCIHFHPGACPDCLSQIFVCHLEWKKGLFIFRKYCKKDCNQYERYST